VNYFQAIVFRESGDWPVQATYHCTIQLNRQTVTRERKIFDQLFQRQVLGYFASLIIDRD
jgi:hypothetical protein